MSNRFPEKRILLRLIARRRDRGFRDEEMFLSMLVIEDQIRAAGAGALAKRDPWKNQGVYRRKDVDYMDGGYRYILGVNHEARREIDRESFASSLEDFDWSSTSQTMAAVRTVIIPAVNLAISVPCAIYEKRDSIAAKLRMARRELRRAVGRALGSADAAPVKETQTSQLPGMSAYDRDLLGLGPYDPNNAFQKAMDAYPGPVKETK